MVTCRQRSTCLPSLYANCFAVSHWRLLTYFCYLFLSAFSTRHWVAPTTIISTNLSTWRIFSHGDTPGCACACAPVLPAITLTCCALLLSASCRAQRRPPLPFYRVGFCAGRLRLIRIPQACELAFTMEVFAWAAVAATAGNRPFAYVSIPVSLYSTAQNNTCRMFQ